MASAPDVPSDTEENNALLAMPSIEKRIKFDEVTPYKAVRAFMKRMILYESLLDELEQGALENDKSLTLEQVIEKMEEHLVPLTFAYSTLSLLTTACADVHKYRIMSTATEAFDKVRTRRFQIIEIYNYLKKEYNDVTKTHNRIHLRWIEKYLLEGKLNGLGHSKDEIDLFNRQMKAKTKNFLENCEKSNKLIHEFIISPSTLSTLPDGFLLKGSRLWSPLDNSIYTRFLQNCNSRAVRRNFFDNYNQRAFRKGAHDNNSVNIEELRDMRKNYALYLGYENFVDLSMETKMAGFVTNVKTMLNTLHLRCQSALQRDLKEMTDFANSSSREKLDRVQLWDLDYYHNLYHKETKNSASEAMHANYPLNSVLKSFFNLCSRLFQIDIVECEAGVGRAAFPSWHPSVRLFDVFSPNGFYGSFYLDPYARNEKVLNGFAQTNFLVSRSDPIPVKPISSLVMNLPPPLIAEQEVHLSFGDVVKLFGCLGKVLQHTLTDVPYSEVNGLTNLEWDMVNMMSEFMSLWPLYDNQTINESCAGSGIGISADLQQQIVERHFKFNSIFLIQELYKSALDLTLHSNTEFWQDLLYDVWDIYMKPFALEKTDMHMCANSEIIVMSPAAYYCPLWSKMVAADLFSLFQGKLDDEKKLSAQGLRMRETFLSESGAHPASEMFKALTERNPSAESLLQLSKSCLVYEGEKQ